MCCQKGMQVLQISCCLYRTWHAEAMLVAAQLPAHGSATVWHNDCLACCCAGMAVPHIKPAARSVSLDFPTAVCFADHRNADVKALCTAYMRLSDRKEGIDCHSQPRCCYG
jgi:hypothetical protein